MKPFGMHPFETRWTQDPMDPRPNERIPKWPYPRSRPSSPANGLAKPRSVRDCSENYLGVRPLPCDRSLMLIGLTANIRKYSPIFTNHSKFSVHRGPIDGVSICLMFNKIASGKDWPKYLSTDNNPKFQDWPWKVNLDIHFHIEEIKTLPYCPRRHPLIERLIGTCRREFTDNILFWREGHLEMKLNAFQQYFNSYPIHYSHKGKTPDEFNGERPLARIRLNNFKWKPDCGGMYHTPIAA